MHLARSMIRQGTVKGVIKSVHTTWRSRVRAVIDRLKYESRESHAKRKHFLSFIMIIFYIYRELIASDILFCRHGTCFRKMQQ